MRILSLSAVLLSAVSSIAIAGDRVQIGPAPDWAKSARIADPSSIKEGPAVLPLLFSQHVRIEPGKTIVHSNLAMKFLAPEGLAAGTISVQWRPDKDEITVHRLVLIRDGRDIDLLASGKKFEVLRREANLERATLDGQLTAVLQPEDLRVGDTIALSMTITSADPVMSKHAEFASGLPNNLSARLVQVRVDWPITLALKHRFYAMPQAKVSREGNWQSVEWQLTEPPIHVPPKAAPTRFHIGRRLEFTDFGTWKDLSNLFRPIYDKASLVPATGPLRDEVEKIRRRSNDPIVQTSSALTLVEDNVRYVLIAMGQGNYVPASATETWQRRYGDCKAKTALLVAILRDLGIAADPVFVASFAGDGLSERLPMVTQFDHVIVRARISGKDYWLDGTRSGDAGIALLAIPAFGWGLPLVADADLVQLQPLPPSRPQTDTLIAMDASAGPDKAAPTRIERTFRGDTALVFSAAMTSVAANARDKALKDYWKGELSDFSATRVSGTFVRENAEYRLIAEGSIKLDLEDGRYEVDVPTPGFDPDFARDAGPDEKAPFAVPFPMFTRTVQTIVIPDSHAQFTLGDSDPIDESLAGRRYRRTMSKNGNLFRIEASTQTLVPEISHADAIAAEKKLRSLNDKSYYVAIAQPTAAETQAALERKPTGLDDYLRKGVMLAMNGRLDEAMEAFGEAIKTDPKNVEAFEGRGMARLQSEDLAGARSDFETAVRLGAPASLTDVITAKEAAVKRDWKTAIAATSSVLEKFPDHTHYLMFRADLYRRSGEPEKAIEDTLRVSRLFPNDQASRLMRINLYRVQGNEAAVLSEAEQILKLKLQDPFGYVAAAKAFAAYGRTAQTARAFDLALGLKREAYIYLNRAETRPRNDLSGRRADLDAALMIDPDDAAANGSMGDFLVAQKDYSGAIARYGAAIKKDPSDLGLRTRRGIALVRSGQTVRADADFAYVRAEAENDAWRLNGACWAKATAGVALESALIDCDLALKLEPKGSGIHDSRGLVLLRLKRIDDAIAAYGKAIEISNDMPSALFGRALAWERKGDFGRAAADAKLALAKNKAIQDTYREIGLELKAK